MKICRKSWLLLAVGCALLPAMLSAAERGTRLKPGEFNPDDETVELFSAMEADQLEVKFIPKDDTVGRLIIKNKTNRPLNVQLPDAFAVMPILAQPGLGGGGGGQAGGGGLGGGGLGGGGLGGGGGGAGGGCFNIKAEKVDDLKVPIVCLEHGKPEPRPAIPYEIRPLDAFSQDPVLYQLMKLFGTGQINRRPITPMKLHAGTRDLAAAIVDQSHDGLGRD